MLRHYLQFRVHRALMRWANHPQLQHVAYLAAGLALLVGLLPMPRQPAPSLAVYLLGLIAAPLVLLVTAPLLGGLSPVLRTTGEVVHGGVLVAAPFLMFGAWRYSVGRRYILEAPLSLI